MRRSALFVGYSERYGGIAMIRTELFYKRIQSRIRERQAAYLKAQRSQPFAQELPTVEEVSAETYAQMTLLKKLAYLRMIRKQRKRYKKALRAQKVPVDERLTRGYNAGVEMALDELESEFKEFYKRLQKEEE